MGAARQAVTSAGIQVGPAVEKSMVRAKPVTVLSPHQNRRAQQTDQQARGFGNLD